MLIHEHIGSIIDVFYRIYMGKRPLLRFVYICHQGSAGAYRMLFSFEPEPVERGRGEMSVQKFFRERKFEIFFAEGGKCGKFSQAYVRDLLALLFCLFIADYLRGRDHREDIPHAFDGIVFLFAD